MVRDATICEERCWRRKSPAPRPAAVPFVRGSPDGRADFPTILSGLVEPARVSDVGARLRTILPDAPEVSRVQNAETLADPHRAFAALPRHRYVPVRRRRNDVPSPQLEARPNRPRLRNRTHTHRRQSRVSLHRSSGRSRPVRQTWLERRHGRPRILFPGHSLVPFRTVSAAPGGRSCSAPKPDARLRSVPSGPERRTDSPNCDLCIAAHWAVPPSRRMPSSWAETSLKRISSSPPEHLIRLGVSN